MTHLKSITLGNVRRFAENVTVPISPQATILLAPNGTGKTALFEAIELALTGGVARLQTDMYALVRDGEECANVSLDFGDFQHVATVSANGNPVQWSGLSPIHGVVGSQDISYLLRLTHLLDQRDRHWFTQEESSNAGEQLARLPFGKDAQYVQNQLTGIKQVISRARTDRERLVNEAKAHLLEWQNMLVHRDEVRDCIGLELPTLEELALALRPFSDCDIPTDSLANLETVRSVSASNISARLTELRGQVAALQQMHSICSAFSTATEALSKLAQVKEQKLQGQQIAQEARDALLAKATEAVAAHLESNLLFQNYSDSLHKVEQHDQLLSTLQTEEAAAVTDREVHANFISAHQTAQMSLNIVKDAENAHALWNARKSDWQGKSTELEQAKNALVIWQANVTRKDACEQRIEALAQAVATWRQVLEEKESELAKATRSAAEAQERLVSLQQSSDQVRAAVAAIAANIAEQRNDCPVCGIVHGAEELRRRMNEQLQSIDPVLRSLSDLASSSREDFIRCERLREESRAQYNLNVQQHEAVIVERNNLVAAITASRQHRLLDADSPDEVGVTLELLQADLDKEHAALEADFVRMHPRPTSEVLVKAQQEVFGAAQRAGEAGLLIQKRQVMIDSFIQQLNLSSPGIKALPSRDELLREVTAQRAIVDQRLSNRQQAESAVSLAEAQLKEVQSHLDGTNVQWIAAKHEVSSYLERWSKERLPGEPNQEVLDRTLIEMEEAIGRTQDASAKVEQIRQQLARLRGAAEFRTIQQRVDDLRVERTEFEYGNHLAEVLEEQEQEFRQVTERKSTLETFSSALSNEMAETHTKFADIEPLWQSFLARIVREPRFSQTGLQYLRRYNKLHAHVQVPVANRVAPASKVASEAQKADIQLSFMLSMALVHDWSPWRALLLDDPTQHHDLVHASAVFDVLRDFIVEHEFQTIVTTHDPIQARFFARKLQNDGVDVQFLTLAPLCGGVDVCRLDGTPLSEACLEDTAEER